MCNRCFKFQYLCNTSQDHPAGIWASNRHTRHFQTDSARLSVHVGSLDAHLEQAER